jgi:hypothetical protein
MAAEDDTRRIAMSETNPGGRGSMPSFPTDEERVIALHTLTSIRIPGRQHRC